ncbi:MAG: GntR family transcriptional regulator [Halanaerobium sp.]|nr:GntR family transcriptional regulator [Halanaerobium sp.]
MEIKLERDTGIPLYIQIKEQIKQMINKGILDRGDKLPAERELAQKLRVSRNRVGHAYKELEQEGTVVSQQGKGTFVAGRVSGVREPSRKDKLLKIIDLAMEEAAGLDFSLDDFLTIAYVRAKEKEEQLKKIKVAFIECNQEQLDSIINSINLGSQVAILAYNINELRDDRQRQDNVFAGVDIVVTTPFHFHEVREMVRDHQVEFVEITLEPQWETVVKLARVPAQCRIGLIAQSETFITEVKKAIDRLGLGREEVISSSAEEEEEIEELVASVDYLITSPHRFQEVCQLSGQEKVVFPFSLVPDRGSVKMLQMALLEYTKDR